MKVEWVWRAPQLLLPIAIVLMQRRSLEGLGLTSRDAFKGAELGILAGILLVVGLAPFFLIWMPAKMPIRISSSTFAYAVIFLLTNVIAMEIFYRGYIQSRFEAVIAPTYSLVITSLLSGLDFLEYKIFNPAIIVVAALVFGFVYKRTGSLVSPIMAHISLLLLTMILLST